MSRYYVFTQEQLDEALALHYTNCPGGSADKGTVRDFLDSKTCMEMGMARDLPLPAAPEMKVALAPASLPEPTL